MIASRALLFVGVVSWALSGIAATVEFLLGWEMRELSFAVASFTTALYLHGKLREFRG